MKVGVSGLNNLRRGFVNLTKTFMKKNCESSF